MKAFESPEELSEWIVNPTNMVSGPFAFLGGTPTRWAVYWMLGGTPLVYDHALYKFIVMGER